MTKYIRMSLEEVRKHLEHEIEFDGGKASFHGEAYRYEYSVWCKTCQGQVGNSITVTED